MVLKWLSSSLTIMYEPVPPSFPPWVGLFQKSLMSHIRVVEETELADRDGHKLLSTWVWLQSDSLLMHSVYRPEGK